VDESSTLDAAAPASARASLLISRCIMASVAAFDDVATKVSVEEKAKLTEGLESTSASVGIVVLERVVRLMPIRERKPVLRKNLLCIPAFFV